jgi:hypothetical protein
MISTSTPLAMSFSTSPAVAQSFIARFTVVLMLGEKTTGIVSAAFMTWVFWASLSPVVATTSGTLRLTQICRIVSVASGTEKSITACGFTLSAPASFKCSSAMPASKPASRPISGFAGESMAATTFSSGSVLASAISRRPMRPAAPRMAIVVTDIAA